MSKIKIFSGLGLIAAGLVLSVAPAFATTNMAGGNDIGSLAHNIVTSGSNLPGLISAMAYMTGILFALSGLFKLKEHVESPAHHNIREPLMRFVAGGMLFSLPIVYQAMKSSIGEGNFDGVAGFEITTAGSGLLGKIGSKIPLASFNHILSNIVSSLGHLPGLVSAVAYLLALVLGFSAILKLKEHVENPSQHQLKEAVVRFLIGGMLFSLPAVYASLQNAVSKGGSKGIDMVSGGVNTLGMMMKGGGECTGHALANSIIPGLGNVIQGLFKGLSNIFSSSGSFAGGFMEGSSNRVSDVVCGIVGGTAYMPAFLVAMAYLFGLFLGLFGLMKLKDHVLNPSQVPLWEPVSRFLACGMFLSLPVVMQAIKATIGDDGITSIVGAVKGIALYFMRDNHGGSMDIQGSGLDAKMVAFIGDIYGPGIFAINWFGYIAGMVFIMIGISRMMKSAQEGPRGPGGMGTMFTFLMGGALLSLSPFIEAFSSSMFGALENSSIYPDLSYANDLGLSEATQKSTKAVIGSIMQFMALLGMISFVRGLFIVRSVAEGSHQASMMAGMTHIIGGSLAMNLGALVNAVQATLGITMVSF